VDRLRLCEDIVYQKLDSERIESRKKELREFERSIRGRFPSLWLYNRILCLLILNNQIIVEDSFAFLFVRRERCIFGLKIFMELEPLSCLIESSDCPCNRIYYDSFIVNI
jgi:hypothetical protein